MLTAALLIFWSVVIGLGMGCAAAFIRGVEAAE